MVRPVKGSTNTKLLWQLPSGIFCHRDHRPSCGKKIRFVCCCFRIPCSIDLFMQTHDDVSRRGIYTRVSDLTLGIIITHGPHGCLEICRCLLLNLVGQMMNFESVEPWNKLVGRTFWPIFWMHHKKHMWEAGAEICPVSVVVSRRFGSVHIHAFGAV